MGAGVDVETEWHLQNRRIALDIDDYFLRMEGSRVAFHEGDGQSFTATFTTEQRPDDGGRRG